MIQQSLKCLFIISLAVGSPFTFATENDCSVALNPFLHGIHKRHRGTGTVLASSQDPRSIAETTCGPVCAANLFQGVRELLGMKTHDNPYAVVQAVLGVEPHYKQGMSPEELHDVIQILLETNFKDQKLKIKSRALEGIDSRSPQWDDVKIVNQITLDHLSPEPNEFILLAYLRIKNDGSLGGAHFVLVKAVSEDRVIVIEPNYPDRNMQFSARQVNVNGNSSIELMPSDEENVEHADWKNKGTRAFVFSVTSVTVEGPSTLAKE